MQAQYTAWWITLLINGEKDCQCVLMQAIVTFNTSSEYCFSVILRYSLAYGKHVFTFYPVKVTIMAFLDCGFN